MTCAALTLVSLHLMMMLTVPTVWVWSWTWTLPAAPSLSRSPPILSSSSFPIPNHQQQQHHHPAIVRRRGSSSSSSSSPSLHKSTTDTTNNEVINSILAEIDALRTTTATTTSTAATATISFPYLRIGPRVGSGSYGTVHQGYLIHSKDTDDDIVVKPCIAKRAWTLAELELDIPSQILTLFEQQDAKQIMAQRTGLAFSSSATSSSSSSSSSSSLSSSSSSSSSANSEKDISASDLKSRAARCEHYWEVERHCFQKMMMAMQDNPNNSITTATGTAVPPLFWGVYRDDGKGGGTSVDNGEATSIPGYGATSSSPPRRKQQSSNGYNFWFLDNTNSDGGTSDDGDSVGHEWMVFEFVGTANTTGDDGSVNVPAQTLLDAMERDWNNQHRIGKDNHHPLFEVQKALNLPEIYTFGDTLDAIFMSILENLIVIHELNIAHRDLKPGNLLCDGTIQQLRLFDFGSAADLDPSPIPPESRTLFSGGTRRVGYDEGIAAISPAYCAPETFIKLNENPLSFDVFSAGLIMSQLLFNLLDERTDAGFLQRMKEVNYDLDAWLENELGAKLRPSGLDGGLEYLSERRGLWSLLKQMFQPNPMMRVSSSKALEQLRKIIGVRKGDGEWSEADIAKMAREEAYFETVIESLESCSFNIGIENMPRPLHFLATFKKGAPIGLMLAEASEVENDGMSSNEWEQWKRATERALPGEVFVRGWDELSQAGQLGIFEIGDRLRGIGELPFVDGGFEQAITLINRQPKGGASLKLHFDRIPSPKASMTKSDQSQNGSRCIKVGGQGAWKSGGRRGAQEDTFVLHEIKNDQRGEDILLAGVFDGHAGTAASETVSGILPSLFTAELMASSETPVRIALENSWETTCNIYRSGCDENGECVAEYDPLEGILFAETGSKDLVAGTTATIVALSMNPSGTDELTILNCGDSRTLVIGQPNSPINRGAASVVVFETRDHSPDDEIEIQRLEQGYAAGLDYSIPQCSPAGSYMVVGDYQYALCRSLEGTFVTSKGIVSDPDVSTLDLASSLADRRHCAVVLACDGLFEVMSNEEVGREVIRMRKEGYKAGDIAKNLCGQALKKGSYDNLSVIVVYLDHVL